MEAHLKRRVPTLGVNSKSLVYSSFNLDKELTQVNPVAALTSGKIKKSDIGKTVYLSNSSMYSQEWIIADIDHDSTTGTVDLFNKYAFEDYDTSASYAYGSNLYYEKSSVRSMLLSHSNFLVVL